MKSLLVTGALALALTGVAAADDLTVNHGQWEFSTTGTMSMAGSVMPMPASTESECILEDEATLSAEDLADEECEVTVVSSTSNQATYNMSCVTEGIAMQGDLTVNVISDGNGATMTGALTGEIPGIGPISVNVNTEGQRTGACE